MSGHSFALLRRILGGVLILLVVAPVWRLVALRAGPAPAEAVALTTRYALLLAQGTILTLGLAGVATWLLRAAVFESAMARCATALNSWSPVRYGLALALLSGVATAALSFYLWQGRPVLIDALAQMVQARYMAAGLSGGPSGFPYEFWVGANTLVTENGWVSQYPPGHMVILAAGLFVGTVWVVGPLLMAVAAWFTVLVAERLFPYDKVVARLGGLLFALSPFMITVAAAYMSHATAAALACVGAYCSLRARDGHASWALGSGLAVGALFATRPLTAVVIGSVVTVGIWLTSPAATGRLRYLVIRVAASFVGALPFLLAVAAYNNRFFGSPLRFGYVAYLGPNHGLGFHPDPFGNPYTSLNGLGYTSSDLLALGYTLFRTPISAVLVIGVFLLVARRLSPGARLLTLWGLSLVAVLAFYWHHDLMLGPRMLSDAAPAWCMLAAVAAVGLVRLIPADRSLLQGRVSVRAWAGTALLAAWAVGMVLLVPRDLRGLKRILVAPPAAPVSAYPTIVFVHDSWNGRMVGRLIAAGMRGDSVAVALEQNSSCRLYEFVNAYEARQREASERGLPQLEFARAATDGSELTRLASGVLVRAGPDEVLTPECLREAEADAGGAVPLLPLVWQGDLPGIGGSGAMYVRDLGPAANAELLRRFPGRRSAVLLRRPSDRVPALVPYDVGMELLWKSETDPDEGA
jgi:hypothetical protein